MFIHINDKLVNSDVINYVDCNHFMKYGFARIIYKSENSECLYGPEAIDVIMRLCPSYLEGKQLKYVKHAWVVHNLIGHPLMQILAWMRLTKWAMKIHDITIPTPKALER